VELNKFKISELSNFYDSDLYRMLDTKPISKARVISYKENPNAKADDIVLYILTEGHRLIAFRSLLPDKLRQHRFAWCSGAWVHKEYRRQGLSLKLLKHAYEDWDQKLMLTNYAPEAEALIKKSDLFQLIGEIQGMNFYLFVRLRELLKTRINAKFLILFTPIDWLIYAISVIRCKLIKYRNIEQKVSVLDYPDNEFYERFNQRNMSEFERTSKELKWILDYPWIKDNVSKEAYHFSYTAYQFSYYFVKFYEKEQFIGFAIVQLRDRVLTIPYYDFQNDDLAPMAKWIFQFSCTQKISVLRIYNEKLSKAVKNHTKSFVFARRNKKRIYGTKFMNKNRVNISDGDGDTIFT
jgi:GNAT superfamily N-acetyltransferase